MEDLKYEIKFIIRKLKEGLKQEKEILEEIKNKQKATYEVEIENYKGKIEICKKKENNCWLCDELEKGIYQMENTNKTLKLKIYREYNGGYVIQADGEDVLQQEINYCPMCGRKLGGNNEHI